MVGNIVTVTFTSSENLIAPTVTIAGSAATVTGGPTLWSATHTMLDSDQLGAVLFSISFSDLAGNAGTPVTAVTDSSSVTKIKATPTITWPVASGIRFGQALSTSILVNGDSGSVLGSFNFDIPATVPSAVGPYSAAITFTPTDTINYNTVSSTVNVVVDVPLSVRILRGTNVIRYHSYIKDAFSDTTISDGDIIEIYGIIFTEDLVYDSNTTITLKGGFSSVENSWYSDNNGTSTLSGTLTVKQGTLRVQKLMLKSTQ